MSVSSEKAGIRSNIGQHGEDIEVYDKVHHCSAILNNNFSAILKNTWRALVDTHDTAELQCEILNYVAVIMYRSMFTSRCNIFYKLALLISLPPPPPPPTASRLRPLGYTLHCVCCYGRWRSRGV